MILGDIKCLAVNTKEGREGPVMLLMSGKDQSEEDGRPEGRPENL